MSKYVDKLIRSVMLSGTDDLNISRDSVYWLLTQPIGDVFVDYKNIWEFLNKTILESSGEPVSFEIAKDFFRDSLSEVAIIDRISELPQVSLEEARYHYKRAVEEREKIEINNLLGFTSKILESNLKIDKNKKLSGLEDAKNFLFEGVFAIGRKYESDVPKGDVRNDGDKILDAYKKSKESTDPGCLCGIEKIDELTRGAQKGELWLVGAFTSEGKSSFALNMAYYNAFMLGKNVVFFTTEMPRDQLRNHALARHSCHDKFTSISPPLGHRDIKNGELSEEEERFFVDLLVPDFTSFPDYGKLEITQVPRGSTINDLHKILYSYQAQFEVDLVIIDMLQHLDSVTSYKEKRDDLDAVLRATKQMAMTFNRGKGIPILITHQINRASREKAEKEEYYSLRAFANTAEAERSADVALWMLRLDAYKERNEVLMGMAKNRDGEQLAPFFCYENYASCYLGDLGDGDLSDILGKPTGDGTMEIEL